MPVIWGTGVFLGFNLQQGLLQSAIFLGWFMVRARRLERARPPFKGFKEPGNCIDYFILFHRY